MNKMLVFILGVAALAVGGWFFLKRNRHHEADTVNALKKNLPPPPKNPPPANQKQQIPLAQVAVASGISALGGVLSAWLTKDGSASADATEDD